MNYTRKKICKFYDICNNCGKQGHTFKQCKHPITSFGVIIFRIRPEDGRREYLMIRRKDTLGYIDFMRGKYSIHNTRYILNMFKQMTRSEKMRLLTKSFDELWQELWEGPSGGEDGGVTDLANLSKDGMISTHSISSTTDIFTFDSPITSSNSFRQEELNSRDKFIYLATTKVGSAENAPPGLPVPSLLQYLVLCSVNSNQINKTVAPIDGLDLCNKIAEWEEPEWGFPKGRRNYQERDYECALREMSEETGYPIELVRNIKNILPFEEYFLGSNYKCYKHKYYLMYMDYDDSKRHEEQETENGSNGFGRNEISSIGWKTYEQCIQAIRPYNLEKIRLVKNIEDALTRYRIIMD